MKQRTAAAAASLVFPIVVGGALFACGETAGLAPDAGIDSGPPDVTDAADVVDPCRPVRDGAACLAAPVCSYLGQQMYCDPHHPPNAIGCVEKANLDRECGIGEREADFSFKGGGGGCSPIRTLCIPDTCQPMAGWPYDCSDY